MRIAGDPRVHVVDARGAQRISKRRLRETAAPRQRQFANIDDPRHLRVREHREQLVERAPLIADRVQHGRSVTRGGRWNVVKGGWWHVATVDAIPPDVALRLFEPRAVEAVALDE